MTDLERYEYVVKPLLEIEQEDAKERQGARTDLEHSTQNAGNVEGESVDLVGEQVRWSGDKVQRLKNISAKTRCQHGEWLEWLKKNCPEITQPTVWRYMNLYEKAKSNYSLLNNLTPIQAYRELGIVNGNFSYKSFSKFV